METVKLFNKGRSQTLSLPKAFRFKTKAVMVSKIDDMVVLFPRNRGWDLLVRALERFNGDFPNRRQTARKEKRKTF